MKPADFLGQKYLISAKDKVTIVLCGLGGGFFGMLCTGAFFWLVSFLISTGIFKPEGNFFKNTPNGNVNYVEGWGCTVDMRKDTEVKVAEKLFKFCLDHHQEFLNKQ